MGDPPPPSGSQAGPCLAASWQTSQSHPARHPEQKPMWTHGGIRKQALKTDWKKPEKLTVIISWENTNSIGNITSGKILK